MTTSSIMDSIPTSAEPLGVIGYLGDGHFSTEHVLALKRVLKANNSILSNLLGITPKTFNTYSKDISKIKIDTKE